MTWKVKNFRPNIITCVNFDKTIPTNFNNILTIKYLFNSKWNVTQANSYKISLNIDYNHFIKESKVSQNKDHVYFKNTKKKDFQGICKLLYLPVPVRSPVPSHGCMRPYTLDLSMYFELLMIICNQNLFTNSRTSCLQTQSITCFVNCKHPN